MTFPTGVVEKREYSEEEISAVLGASEQERKRLQKLAKITETVAAYRLREIKTSKQESSWLPGGGLMVTIESQMTMTVGLFVPAHYRLKSPLRVCVLR